MRFSQTLNSVMTSVRVTLGCAYQLARLLSKHVGDEVMRYIEACERPTLVGSNYISLFLAGSINGAPNWQQRYAGMFEDTDLVLFNPRRPLCDTPYGGAWTSEEGQRQIDWEHEHLRKAHAISFWFAAEGQGFSSALELGTAVERDLPVFVGVHPMYWKASTIAYQTKKARPNIVVVESLAALANQVRTHFGYAPLKED